MYTRQGLQFHSIFAKFYLFHLQLNVFDEFFRTLQGKILFRYNVIYIMNIILSKKRMYILYIWIEQCRIGKTLINAANSPTTFGSDHSQGSCYLYDFQNLCYII